MNKQRYLAELQRLLVFMTPGDRERTVRRFSNMFDAAGPEGEAALIEELGSPTKAAIGLSRGYTPDSVPEPAEPEPPVPDPADAPAPEKASDDPWEDIPDFEPPALEELEETAAAPADTESAAEPVPPAPADTPAVPAPDKTSPTLAQLREEFSAPEEPEEPEAPAKKPRAARSMPLWLGIPLFILVFAALGVPLAVLLAAVTVVLLTPGCVVLYAAWLIFVGGLWCTNFMADAILLFGVCAIVLALGLMILFLGLWLAVTLIRLYGKGFGWVAGELLGRRVTDDA